MKFIYQCVKPDFPENAAGDLVPLPFESIISSVWRYGWRNGLNGGELRRYCTRSGGYSSASLNITYSWFAPDVFASASGWELGDIESTTICSGDIGNRPTWWSETFRYCPLCLEHAYHSYWHQSLFLTHCPLDGAKLEQHCYHCRKRLPYMRFSHALLDTLYACPECKNPISGVHVWVGHRVIFQERGNQIDCAFRDLDRWWRNTAGVRAELHRLTPGSAIAGFARWLRPESSARQWLIAAWDTEVAVPLPASLRMIPPLVTLRWQVREFTPNVDAVHRSRKPRQLMLAHAAATYRTTLRRLEWLIGARFPYDEKECSELLKLPRLSVVHSFEKASIPLLALCLMRLYFETYASVRFQCSSTTQLNSDACFPDGEHEGHRMRLAWRAYFLSVYAWLYWMIVAIRNGRLPASEDEVRSIALSHIDVEYDFIKGNIYRGAVAFPAIDGLEITLFPLARGRKPSSSTAVRSPYASEHDFGDLRKALKLLS